MTMHSFYFISYALILTFSGIVMASAYYSLNKREGAPINYKLLAVVFGAALAMWTAAAVTEYAYNPSRITAGFSILFLTTWIGVGVNWQLSEYMKKHHVTRML